MKILLAVTGLIVLLLLIPGLSSWWSPEDELRIQSQKEIASIIKNETSSRKVLRSKCFSDGVFISKRVCNYFVVAQVPNAAKTELSNRLSDAGWKIDSGSASGQQYTKPNAACYITMPETYYDDVAHEDIRLNGYYFACYKFVIGG